MAKCSVPKCKLNSEQKFASPRNEQQLSLWQKILNIKNDKFFVCSDHFEEKFVRVKKLGVTTDAYPSMYLSSCEEKDSEICQCCLKSFLNTYFSQADEFYKITEDFQGIFRSVMECDLPLGLICGKCHDYVKSFNTFRINIKKNQLIRESMNKRTATNVSVKDEPTDYDDVEILEYEQERISVADDDEFNVENGESSVIKFVDVNEVESSQSIDIKKEKFDGENSEDSSEKVEERRATRAVRTYSNRSKASVEIKTEKLDDFSMQIKEEPIDESGITNYDLLEPTTSLITDFKSEPGDEFDFEEIHKITSAARAISNKRPLNDADIPNAPKNRRIIQGSSPYTSSLPLKPSRRIAINPTTGKHIDVVAQNFKCQYCTDRFSNRDEMVDHIAEKHNFKCPQCPAQFQYKITLIQHEMSEHAGQQNEQTGRLPVAYRHSCPVCKLKFASSDSLKSHMRQKHKITKFFGIDEGGSGSSKSNNDKLSLPERIVQKYLPTQKTNPRSALIKVQKEVDTETLSAVHQDLNGIPCVDCGLLYKPNKLEKHRMEKHNRH